MDKKRKLTLIVLGIVIIALCTVATYAYFTATITGNSNNKNVKVDMSKMKLEFSDKTGKVVADNINPGWTYQKKVSVTNTGTVPVKYDLVWLKLQNEIEQDEMVYSIECSNCNGIDENPVPSYGGKNLKIVTNTIDASQTQEYTINFTFKEINDAQDYNQNKKFFGNIGIKENNTYEESPIGLLSDTDWQYTIDDENNKVTLTQYVSSNPNVEIYPVYIKDNKEYKTVIKEGISTWQLVTLFKQTSYGTTVYDANVEKVKFMGNVEFENNSMKYLFYGCQALKEIDITKIDFSKISTVYDWLINCTSITNQDQIKGFNNLAKLTNMSGLFNGLSKIQNINIKSWDTSKVTNMSSMFYNCSSLTNLDVTNFDTSNVTNMFGMFHNCSSLTSLDVSHFDTSNVTDMNIMFEKCSSLKSLSLLNFNTSNVTYMGGMFAGCSSLTKLDLSSFNTEKLTATSPGPSWVGAFGGMTSLKELDLSSFDFSNITNWNKMFTDTPSDVKIYTSDTGKIWLNEKFPELSNVVVKNT